MLYIWFERYCYIFELSRWVGVLFVEKNDCECRGKIIKCFKVFWNCEEI